MIIEGITLRPYFENAYILGDERTKRAIVVDPGAEPERVLAALDRQGLTAKLILCTHGHIGAVTPVRQSTGALFDLFGSNPQQLLQSIRDKVLPLPDATEVRSGHGPLTTVGHERANNRYILEMDRIISGELAL